MELTDAFWWFVLIGLGAQLIDGALGMAFGLVASSILLGMGLPPAAVSASVHTAEIFTTGASGVSHLAFGNVDRRLFLRLALPGMVGGVIGAWLLTRLPGDAMRPFVYAYLLVLAVLETGMSADEIAGKIKASLDRALNDEVFRASLVKIGFPPLRAKSQAEIDKFVDTDRARWAGVVKALNISLD